MFQGTVYDQARLWDAVSHSRHPAIVITEFSYGFIDTQYSTAAHRRIPTEASRGSNKGGASA